MRARQPNPPPLSARSWCTTATSAPTPTSGPTTGRRPSPPVATSGTSWVGGRCVTLNSRASPPARTSVARRCTKTGRTARGCSRDSFDVGARFSAEFADFAWTNSSVFGCRVLLRKKARKQNYDNDKSVRLNCWIETFPTNNPFHPVTSNFDPDLLWLSL